MSYNNLDEINRLNQKLELLLKRQDDFSREIKDIQLEIRNLGAKSPGEIEQGASSFKTEFEYQKEKSLSQAAQQKQKTSSSPQPMSKSFNSPKVKSDLEKFIGENLINKLGIGITVIGVGIGAKYAIDHQLISPLTRILLAYMMGIVMLVFAIKLKKDYENFSAVLLSGSTAIMYFITYFAYSLYELIPQLMAFVLMLILTAFTVLAALKYNKQIIAHIGLVGAYAVPILLSDGSGKVGILFSYVSIINLGILTLSFKKYWKPLYYSSFGLSWLMYSLWYVSDYTQNQHFVLALTFLLLFFVTFYLSFLAYKLLKKEKFELDDIFLLLANSFIFFGLGFLILDEHQRGTELLGLFTICNAVVHFVVSFIFYRQKLADRNLFYLISGLVLLFITIAVPVQLDANWVTLLWAGEAALLFWVGRSKNVPIYEKLSYPLMVLAFFSLLQDWSSLYGDYYVEEPKSRISLLFNINFLTSILFIAAFAFIYRLQTSKNYEPAWRQNKGAQSIISLGIPAILLISIYYAFRMEIATYWNQLYTDSALIVKAADMEYPNYHWDHDLNRFKSIWILNYSLLFFSLLAFLNIAKFRDGRLGRVNILLISFTMLVFLIQGLYALSGLRESYLEQSLAEYYHRGFFNIGIRYVSFAFVALAFFAVRSYLRQDFLQRNFNRTYDFFLHISLLWIASSELIHCLDMANFPQSYKLGLSILWGAYALFLIALGIWKKKKYLRIGAIVLFGVTLLKLFMYDISHLDTIAKTIVFVSLGVLLLIISFLYNKYKHIISNEALN